MSFLSKFDPEIADAIENEINRQRSGLEMIASENIVSRAVLEAMGTPLTNKYSEGYPGKRYYGGNQFIDVSENLAIDRAKKIFGAEHANVQPHSGSQANAAAYFALLNPSDKILAMNLAHGGHLSHGAPVNFSGKFYNVVFYGVSKDTGRIDMDDVREIALREKPRLILTGASAYPREIDFAAFRKIADEVGAYLMADIAHIAGLVAAKIHSDPVPVCDVVTTTTHKTLRGPRGALILSKIADRLRPEDKKNLAQKIDSAVFPGMQGGPLEHVIAAKAVAMLEALQPDFIEYQKQIVKNAKVLAETLLAGGLKLVSGGTDNHLILIDLTDTGLAGKQVEDALGEVEIYVNKNMIPYDTRKPTDPSGIRLGTPALTTRGMKENEMKLVGEMIVKIVKNIADENIKKEVRESVRELVTKFPIYQGFSVL
ncbi:serine hydroxymethyltransferase [Candidatus Falkowbacteria bacterium]|nr:serine hydroxymethyltransferase [Candidatus Falkowbacteria bacterium]